MLLIISSTILRLKGLRRNRSYMPAAFCMTADSGKELISIAGISPNSGALLTAPSMPGPSSTGIMKSKMTRSGRLSFSRSRPCFPLMASTTSCPASVSADWSTSAMPNSSSTTRILATLTVSPAVPGPHSESGQLGLMRSFSQDLLRRRGVFVDGDARVGDCELVKGRVDQCVPNLHDRDDPVPMSSKLNITHNQDNFRYTRYAFQRSMTQW